MDQRILQRRHRRRRRPGRRCPREYGIREAAWLAAGLVILAIVMVLLARRAFGKAG